MVVDIYKKVKNLKIEFIKNKTLHEKLLQNKKISVSFYYIFICSWFWKFECLQIKRTQIHLRN